MTDDAKKTYEVSFLAKSENGAATMVGHLARFGAEILDEGDLRKVELSYPIEKQTTAYFGCINCVMPTGVVRSVEDAVRLDSEIMRILILIPMVVKDKISSKNRTPLTEKPTEAPAKTKTVKETEKEKGVLSNELLEEKLEEILK